MLKDIHLKKDLNLVLTTGPLPRQQFKIRKYPYPYKCALTICNDIDDCDLNTFLQIHLFLNSTKDTKYGKGLGLDIGDSFWLYSNFPKDMAYFRGLSNTCSSTSEIIADFIREGYIDCLHSYGNMFMKNITREKWRKLIMGGLNRLRNKGSFVNTWINHGINSIGGNLYARNHPNFCGDDPNCVFYHTDILKNYGIRYVWLNELTDVLIHEVTLNKAIFAVSKEMAINIGKNIFKLILGKSRRFSGITSVNSLIEQVILRDGNKFLKFKRFHIGSGSLWNGANREGLVRQLGAPVLKKLIAREGTVIIYTHLGKTDRLSNNPIFDKKTVKSLRQLAKKFKSGEIFVTTTSRLLNFILIRNSLLWKEHISGDGFINIVLEYINDPLDGKRKIRLNDLKGICFKTTKPFPLRIFINDKEIKPDFVQKPDGKYFCTGFNYPKLKFPEKYADRNFIKRYIKLSNKAII